MRSNAPSLLQPAWMNAHSCCTLSLYQKGNKGFTRFGQTTRLIACAMMSAAAVVF